MWQYCKKFIRNSENTSSSSSLFSIKITNNVISKITNNIIQKQNGGSTTKNLINVAPPKRNPQRIQEQLQ